MSMNKNMQQIDTMKKKLRVIDLYKSICKYDVSSCMNFLSQIGINLIKQP